jgi:hypothetical protein
VLDQGLAKKAQETKGHCYANQGHCYANQVVLVMFTQTNPDSHARSRSGKKGSGNKGHCYANRTDIHGNRTLSYIKEVIRKEQEEKGNGKKTD